jgi:transcription elongation GreA/GreB family factor
LIATDLRDDYRIWRIWSTDWFRTPKQETQKLMSFLEDLRRNWKSEYTTSQTWIEESNLESKSASEIKDETKFDKSIFDSNSDVETVKSLLVGVDDDLEIEVGDVIQYVDITSPNDLLTVQLTHGKDDLANGVINASRPLAQVLLGAVKGDQVILHLAGNASKTFQIVEIKRSTRGQTVLDF